MKFFSSLHYIIVVLFALSVLASCKAKQEVTTEKSVYIVHDTIIENEHDYNHDTIYVDSSYIVTYHYDDNGRVDVIEGNTKKKITRSSTLSKNKASVAATEQRGETKIKNTTSQSSQRKQCFTHIFLLKLVIVIVFLSLAFFFVKVSKLKEK